MEQTSPANDVQVLGSEPEQCSALTYDPKEQIEDFNWDDLEAKFCKDIEKCENEEQRLNEEFNVLIKVSCFQYALDDCSRSLKYFDVWSKSMHAFDSERATKRFVTISILILDRLLTFIA